MSKPVRFGLVGAGRIAQAYAEAFQASSVAQLVGVADVREEPARALAEGVGCRGYRSVDALIADQALDALVICTPPSTHAEICLSVVERGIHVLCEKPLSVDSQSARLMMAAARRAGVTVAMASKFRFVEDVVRAKSIVLSGILGEIVLFENSFTSRVDMSTRWNADRTVSGGGVLIDNGTHSVDLLRYFLGPLAEVHVIEGKRIQGLDVEETVRMYVRSVSGVIACIDLSWSIDKERDSYIEIYGSQGTVRVGWKASKYQQASSPEWVPFGKGYDKVHAFRNQLDQFASAIRGETVLLMTGDDAVASVETIETAYAALSQRTWMAIAPATAALAPAGNRERVAA